MSCPGSEACELVFPEWRPSQSCTEAVPPYIGMVELKLVQPHTLSKDMMQALAGKDSAAQDTAEFTVARAVLLSRGHAKALVSAQS